MPDYVRGVDTSHFQKRPNYSQIFDQGNSFFVLKATQGLVVDPDFDWARNEVEKLGADWAAYHWVLPDDTEAAITHCVEQVLSKGDCLALDWEQSGVASDVMARDMAIAEQALGRQGLRYHGKWPPAPLTADIVRWPHWYAQYPQDSNSPPGIPLWDGTSAPDWSKECLVWQFTGSGRLPGVTTAIDEDRVLCPAEMFHGWMKTGAFPTLPPSSKTTFSVPAIPSTLQFSGAVLHLNGSGPDYALLQMKLNQAGAHLTVDAHAGPLTIQALVAYQKAHGLTPDGIAGPASLHSLSGVT